MMIAPTIPAAPASPSGKITPPPSTAQVLRALILKELRQNLLILALVICGEALIAFAGEWFTNGYISDIRFRGTSIFLLPATGIATWYGSILAASFLGLFQPQADRTFDVWAFLRHRPVPPNILYLGRIIAGMILYFIAVGFPILLLCIWDVSVHRDFYVWQYMLPSIADFFAGIPYYFAAYLIADRQTRLYGSRLLPIALAVAASIASNISYYFIVSVLISLLISVLLALAAEGSAISHGFTLPSPRRSRIALFLTLLLGFSFIATSAEGLRDHFARKNSTSISTFMQYRYVADLIKSHADVIENSRVLLPNGTLAIKSTIQEFDKRHGVYDSSNTSYADMAGNQIAPPDSRLLDQIQNSSLTYTGYNFDQHPGLFDIKFRQIYSLVQLYSADRPNNPRSIQWYGDRPRHLFYLYERITLKNSVKNTFLGSFGSNGLVSPGATATPFNGDLNLNYLREPHTLFFIDPYNMTLSTVFHTQPDEILLRSYFDYFNNRSEPDLRTYQDTIVSIITSRRFLRLAPTGTILAQFPLTHDPLTHQISITPIPSSDPAKPAREWAVRYINIERTRNMSMIGPDPKDYWEFYDDQGHLLSSQTFPTWRIDPPGKPYDYQFPPKLVRAIRRNDIRQGVALALASPVTTILANIIPPAISHDIHDDRYPLPSDSLYLFNSRWITLSMSILLLLFAAAAWALSRLYRLRHPLLWALLALLCGPTALLTLFTFNTWPRRTKCPTCHKPRPLNEDLCPHCHSPWPLPTTTATEIFA